MTGQAATKAQNLQGRTTGTIVHAPATDDQVVTWTTRCTPFGRMGARQADYRWTSRPVTCKRCLSK